MSTLGVPEFPDSRRRNVNPARTPDRPIVNRNRTNSSVSSLTPGSVFDEDIPPSPSNRSPLTPCPSPSVSRNGNQIAPPVLKEYKFVEVTASEAKGRPPARNRKSSGATQASCEKDSSSRQAAKALFISELPQNTLPDQKQQLSEIMGPNSSRRSHTSHSVRRPVLARKISVEIIDLCSTDDDSGDGAEDRSAILTDAPETLDRALATNFTAEVPKQDQADLGSPELKDEDLDPFTTKDPPKGLTHLQAHRIIFSQYGVDKEVHTLNHDICKYILSKRKMNPDYICHLGHVYIFESPHHAPDHVKIGFSKDNPLNRLNTYKRECQIKSTIVKQENPDAILHYKYLETIIHLALHPHRRQYKCNKCKEEERTHKEWFEIPKEKALEQVKLWRDWILKEKPFNLDGTLTDYWHWRAKKLPASMHTVCWEEWTRPIGFERLDYVDFMIEMWQKEHWIGFKKHMGRKDLWFWKMGTIFSLLVCLKFGSLGFCLAVIALVML